MAVNACRSFGPLVLVHDGWCSFRVSHGLVDVVVSGLCHDFSVIAGLITSKILIFFYAAGRPIKIGKPRIYSG
jgi:hypothetical protein